MKKATVLHPFTTDQYYLVLDGDVVYLQGSQIYSSLTRKFLGNFQCAKETDAKYFKIEKEYV